MILIRMLVKSTLTCFKDLYMNTNKMEFLSFKQERAISTLSGKPLK